MSSHNHHLIDMVTDISDDLLLTELPRVESCVSSGETSLMVCTEVINVVKEGPHDVALLIQAERSAASLRVTLDAHRELLTALKTEKIRRGL